MDKFERRVKIHDKFENEIMDIVRPYTDRRHLPDRRVSFGGVPCSFDVKSTVFVEANSHDEYFRLLKEGEPVFIVFKDKNDDVLYGDWIDDLVWAGPFAPSDNSTSGDYYYRITSQRTLADFLKNARAEAIAHE